MWNTAVGVRIVTGAEAAPLRDAVSVIVEAIHNEACDYSRSYLTGVSLFDSLTWTQRLTLLEQVTAGLLLTPCEVAKPSALHDAAIGAIYRVLEDQIGAEIDRRDGFHWRKTVRDAYRSCFEAEAGDEYYLPARIGDQRHDRWEYVVEQLFDRILQDRDYEVASAFLDLDPDQAASLREVLGIDDTYYSNAGEDISPQNAETVFARIRTLIVG